jgi:hypothetical protein
MDESAPKTIPITIMSAPQRVEAILAERILPATKSLVLEYAGVVYDELPDGTRQEVDNLFQQPHIEITDDPKLGTRYSIAPDHREATLQRLGTTRQAVHFHVLKKLLANPNTTK